MNYTNNKFFRRLVSLYGTFNRHLIAKRFEITEKTVGNWLADRTPCPTWAIEAMRKLLSDDRQFKLDDLIDVSYLDQTYYARFKSTSTYTDRDRLLSYFYLRINEIKNIVLFSRFPDQEDCNKFIFNCLIVCKNEIVIMDCAKMTASRTPREDEIISIFHHFHANGFENKLLILEEKIPPTKSFEPKRACEVVLSANPVSLTKYNVQKFVEMIRGSLLGADLSEYIMDDGKITIEKTVEYALNHTNGLLPKDFIIEHSEKNIIIQNKNVDDQINIYESLNRSFSEVYEPIDKNTFQGSYRDNDLILQILNQENNGDSSIILKWEVK